MAIYQLMPADMVVKVGTLWIPPDPNNPDRQEYEVWLNAGNTPDPMPAIDTTPLDIGLRQFYQGMSDNGYISESEAKQIMKNGKLPSSIEDYIGTLPTDEQFAADMFFSSSALLVRTDPRISGFATHMAWTEEQLKDLWVYGATL